ncbi:unnamed protein product [Symbiodinium natans]|uniref:EF-hand domain-containing protein n=1 Tax=Symbiodinium natans TaxID=878477 RepID=A0A812U2C4_9DINO|nr:unnamed protein product [Symbiodinium natans]
MDGKLSRDELKAIFQKVSNWDDDMIDLLLEQCDYNKDGQLQVREFIDFMFRGAKMEREERGRPLRLVRIMAMHQAYFEDLQPRVTDFFHKHGIKNIDLNYEAEWEKALPYCEENDVDVLVVDSDAIRCAVRDDATLWAERDKWFDKHEIPEGKLFQIMPFLQEIVKKSKNPVIALHPWLKETKSQAACLDRITSQLREWRDGIKEKLKNYGDRLEQKERFQDRISDMEALIEASEAEEKRQKERDIAAFRPLFQQIADKAGWDEKRAEQVFDRLVRGTLYTETWFVEAFTEGSVEKELDKISVEQFPEDEMTVLTDFAFEHNDLAKTVRYLASKTGWDLKDQQQVCHKLRRVGCVENRSLQVALKTKSLNARLKKHKFLPFGDSSLEILEGWASIYAASHSLG